MFHEATAAGRRRKDKLTDADAAPKQHHALAESKH